MLVWTRTVEGKEMGWLVWSKVFLRVTRAAWISVEVGWLWIMVTYGCLQLCLLLLRWSFCWWDEHLTDVRGLRLQWSR